MLRAFSINFSSRMFFDMDIYIYKTVLVLIAKQVKAFGSPETSSWSYMPTGAELYTFYCSSLRIYLKNMK